MNLSLSMFFEALGVHHIARLLIDSCPSKHIPSQSCVKGILCLTNVFQKDKLLAKNCNVEWTKTKNGFIFHATVSPRMMVLKQENDCNGVVLMGRWILDVRQPFPVYNDDDFFDYNQVKSCHTFVFMGRLCQLCETFLRKWSALAHNCQVSEIKLEK